MSNFDGELSEQALTVLRQLDFGGTVHSGELDTGALRELQNARMVRGYAGGRVSINEKGTLYLGDLKAERGSLPPIQRSKGLTIVRGQAHPTAHANGGAGDGEGERCHAALDGFGVPRSFYGTPLLLETRIKILLDACGGKTVKGWIDKRLKANPAFSTPES